MPRLTLPELAGQRPDPIFERYTRGIKAKDERPVARRNVTDLDSRLMQDRNGGMIQGYNAQLAVSDGGLILSPQLVQDANDRRQLQPMIQAALTAALLIHRARCSRQCPALGRCCIDASAERDDGGHPWGCAGADCPCRATGSAPCCSMPAIGPRTTSPLLALTGSSPLASTETVPQPDAQPPSPPDRANQPPQRTYLNVPTTATAPTIGKLPAAEPPGIVTRPLQRA
jgi:hypothetical protein